MISRYRILDLQRRANQPCGAWVGPESSSEVASQGRRFLGRMLPERAGRRRAPSLAGLVFGAGRASPCSWDISCCNVMRTEGLGNGLDCFCAEVWRRMFGGGPRTGTVFSGLISRCLQQCVPSGVPQPARSGRSWGPVPARPAIHSRVSSSCCHVRKSRPGQGRSSTRSTSFERKRKIRRPVRPSSSPVSSSRQQVKRLCASNRNRPRVSSAQHPQMPRFSHTGTEGRASSLPQRDS